MNVELVVTVVVSLFGSGGIVLWMLNRIAKNKDERKEEESQIEEIIRNQKKLQEGLVMALENDKVIFTSLRTHEINGESKEQEKKMDTYFLSLLKEKGEK